MAIAKNEKQWAADAAPDDYILDDASDVKNLPACCPGSVAIVVATGEVYMVNASGEWKLFGGGE